jgi:hypothetical protein
MSLFTKVPVKETMDLLGCHFKEGILGPFRYILITSYFTFAGEFYGKTDGVAMVLPLSPVIVNFYMEGYENVALESVP